MVSDFLWGGPGDAPGSRRIEMVGAGSEGTVKKREFLARKLGQDCGYRQHVTKPTHRRSLDPIEEISGTPGVRAKGNSRGESSDH